MNYSKPEFRRLASAVVAVESTDGDKDNQFPEGSEQNGTTTTASAYQADE